LLGELDPPGNLQLVPIMAIGSRLLLVTRAMFTHGIKRRCDEVQDIPIYPEIRVLL
jgi:hypothetical protein